MKFQLLVLWATAIHAQWLGPQLPTDISLGNLIAALTVSFNNLMKTLSGATTDFMTGTPLGVVFDQTLPKVLSEGKLHKRTVMKPEKPIRAGSITAKAAFGPYELVAKNVSALQE